MDEVEPCHDIAHLAHVELLTPKPEESLRFFVDVMGMQETARAGDSVYLRGWDDYEHHTLQLTAAKRNGIGHFAFRATSRAALRRRARALEATGLGQGWTDGDVGHGPAYLATDPDGHRFEIYYETEWYQATPALKPALKNQAARYSSNGIGVRRLDHLNLLANDIRATRLFLETTVGLRTTEMIVLDSGEEAGIWLTATNKSYDIAFTHDDTGRSGRFHHVTYAVDSSGPRPSAPKARPGASRPYRPFIPMAHPTNVLTSRRSNKKV